MEHLEINRGTSPTKVTHSFLKSIVLLYRSQATLMITLGIAVALLLAWELGVQSHVVSALYFPSPSFIVETLWKLSSKGVLVKHIYATLLRFFIGLVLGTVPGLMLGFPMGMSRKFRKLIDPFIAAFHPLPKIALLPLIMVIFGVGDISLVLAVATGAFFPILINTMDGVRQIDPIHFEVAKNYGASKIKLFQRVVFPCSLPAVLTGFRVAVNTTILLTIAVEILGAQWGLGGMIWLAWNTMRIEEIYVCLLIITLLGVILMLLLQYLYKRLIPWHEENS